jgi:hypothetical protein
MLWLVWSLAAQQAPDLKTRIGIFDLDGVGDEAFAAGVVEKTKSALLEVGSYEIYTQRDMEATYEKLKLRFPGGCEDPLCAAAVGRTLQLDRILYGSADKVGASAALRLWLIDVPSRQVLEKTSIVGKDTTSLEQVALIAVKQLHGQDTDSEQTTRYYGPQIRREKQLLSSVALIAAGVTWALLNKTDNGASEGLVYDYSRMADDDENLSGIATGADLIPLFARPAALANAYIAASDDAAGVFFNPAGLAWLRGGEAAVSYQSRFGIHSFAASYANLALRDLAFGQGIHYCGDDADLFQELYFYTSIAYRFNEVLPILGPLSLGASGKILSKKILSTNSPDSPEGGAAGFALDAGAQLQVAEHIRGALLVKNALSILPWTNASTDTSYYEGDAPTFYWGGTFVASPTTFLICEVKTPLVEDQKWHFAGGIEWLTFRVFSVRAGIAREVDYQTPWQLTGGFGLDVQNLSVDGSYEYNTVNAFSNVLNISTRFRF